MGFTDQIKKTTLRTAFNYLEKNPEENAPKLLDWVDRLAGDGPDSFPTQRAAFRQVLADPQNNMYQLIMSVLNDIDKDVLKATFENFFLNANIIGWPKQEEYRKKYQCNIPWAILLDPTSACNLHCTGCWAAEYGHKLNLSYEDLDSIITQGKKLGIYFYMYTGGEPLVRKKDLIRLCEKHNDCAFHAFTNGTLIDEEMCKEMVRVGNLSVSISLEGYEEVNDSRRGAGCFDKVTHAMDLMKQYGLIFGTSICYTSKNYKVVTSDEFLDMIIEKGARFSWYFHYMPVGNDASTELLLDPDQREYMYHRIREIRAMKGGKPIFAFDFQNDGEYVGGCIAGGRNYCHINPKGDVEPCVFIHYSGANIREKSLLECLKQPLFMAYRDNQPFNDNMLRPCPMLENPEILQRMVHETGAHSTDVEEAEPVEHLCGKCEAYACEWKETADEIGRAHV